MGRPLKPRMSVEMLCPLTEVMLGTQQIMRHYCSATSAREGRSIYIRCSLHDFQGFVNHPEIVEKLHAQEAKAVQSAAVERRVP